MQKRGLMEAYGTPISVSAISKVEEVNFDFEEEDLPTLGEKREDLPSQSPRQRIVANKASSVRFGVRSKSQPADFSIVRIWHPDNLFKEVKDSELGNITSFKSIKVTSATLCKDIRDTVSSKLVIKDPSKFALYTIQNKTKRLIKEDEELYPITKNPAIKIALLVLGDNPDEEGEIAEVVGVSGYSNDIKNTWEPLARYVTAHRRLLDHEKYANMSNVTIVVQGVKIHSFRSIIETRFPAFFKSDIVKKKREKKSHITLLLKEDVHIDVAVILQILDYLYTGEIDFKTNSVTMTLKVLYTAEILHIDRLEWLCEHYLHSILSMKNVFEMYVVADKLKLSGVKKFCTAFAHTNWGAVSCSKTGLEILGLDLFQELTISVSKKEEIDLSFLDRPATPSTLEEDLKKMFATMTHADATAELTDGKTIVFHRAFVAAHDRALFTYINSQRDQKAYKFPIDSESFGCFLRFVYYGGTNGISVHCAASVIEEMIPKYPLAKYRAICEENLAIGLTLETVLRILKVTYLPWNQERKKLLSLRKDCLTFIASNFAEVNIPSIREMDHNIAFDLLELMYDEPPRLIRPKEQLISRRGTPSVMRKAISFA